MRDELQNALIGQLKTEAHSSPDLTTMSDEQLKQLIERLLEEKVAWVKTNKPEIYKELSALNFREKRAITDAVMSLSVAWVFWGKLSMTWISQRS